ncbi:hypothetical protein GQ473_02010, partial [archaeon]|nr:hypothetical protein [archaeon]
LGVNGIVIINATSNSAIDSCLLSSNGGANNTMNNISQNSFIYNISSFGSGAKNIDVYCNDTDGDILQVSYFFVVDITAPIITLFSPIDTSYNYDEVSLDYNVDDADAICNYSLNNLSLGYLDDNTTLNAVEGVNELVVSCVDELNNTGFVSTNFTVDYPEKTYFQKSKNITTGEPFIMAYKITLNNTDDKNLTVNLWGLYDTDGDVELSEECEIQSNIPIAITLNDSSYPAKIFLDVSEFNETELSILITWNVTIEPVNFDLNRWAEPINNLDGSWTFASEREYMFILPTNFSMNYTNVRVVWPYVSDGDILDVSVNLPSFELTERGIETTFEKVVGDFGYFSGKGEYNGITNFVGAYIHFSNTTSQIIADLPFIRYIPHGLEIYDEYTEISSVVIDNFTNKVRLHNFYSYGFLEGEISRGVVTVKNFRQYSLPIAIEGIHISSGVGDFDAASPSDYWANVGWDNTKTEIFADGFTHKAYKYVLNITANLERIITVKGNEIILSYNITNEDLVPRNYNVWFIDFSDMLKNNNTKNTNLNKQYVFYENNNTTKELMHVQEKTRCIGLIEEQVHQSALYCPIQPYMMYIQNENLANEKFLIPPKINDSFELNNDGSILPSTMFEFNTGSVDAGSSAKMSMYIFTSVLSESEADAETFDDAILRMNNNLIEKIYLDDSGIAEIIYGDNELLETIDVEVISSNFSEELRTVEIKNSDVFGYVLDETELNTESYRVISSVSYNGNVLETNKYIYNNVSGTLLLLDLKANIGINIIEINYLPFEPQWLNRDVSPKSPTFWADDKDYVFSIDWIDDYGIDSVIFRFDNVDYEVINWSVNTYTYQLVNLSCGEYDYVWRANDTDGNIVETPEKKYKITGDDCDVVVDVPKEKKVTPVPVIFVEKKGVDEENIIDDDNNNDNKNVEKNSINETVTDRNNVSELNTTSILDVVENQKGFFGYLTFIGSVVASLFALSGMGLLISNKNVREHVKRKMPKRRNSQLAQSLRAQQLRKIKERMGLRNEK